MRRKLFVGVAAGVLLAVGARAGWAQGVVPSGDARLARRVSIVGEQISVGKLLQSLARQSGVNVGASDVDGAAGERVWVGLKDVPLRDAMEALWSLVSYQKAAWKWEVSGSGARRVYRLRRPKAARTFFPATTEAVQRDFERHVATLLQGIHLTSEERAKLARRDPVAGKMLESEQTRTGYAIFQSALSLAQKREILRGKEGDEVVVPMASLSREVQALIYSPSAVGAVRAFAIKHDSKLRESDLMPDKISFTWERPYDSVPPTLRLFFGYIALPNYLSEDVLSDAWNRRLDAWWRLPGDRTW